jgi:dTDP-4-dehydrorhamnose 3,5-epimerase
MTFIETSIEGVVIVEPTLFCDSRGYFFESYNQRDFAARGLALDFVQDNQSQSLYGTIRGLHFQRGEHAQAKYIRVLSGRIRDVLVDLRADSASYGRHLAVELSAENLRGLYVPRGFAHGFAVLSERATVSYKCDRFYCRAAEGGIRYDDPALAIDWGVPADVVLLSDKDRALPLFKDYRPCCS